MVNDDWLMMVNGLVHGFHDVGILIILGDG